MHIRWIGPLDYTWPTATEQGDLFLLTWFNLWLNYIVWDHYNMVTFSAYNSDCSKSKLAKTHLALCKHSPALWIRPVLALGGCDSGV